MRAHSRLRQATAGHVSCSGGPASGSSSPAVRRSPSVPDLRRDPDRLACFNLRPRQYVDYLHHNWSDSELTESWRLVTRLKKSELESHGRGERLEYLTWRIWMQRRMKLSKIHPHTIDWDKDSTHLFAPGPLFSDTTAADAGRPRQRKASVHRRCSRGVLKKHSLKYTLVREAHFQRRPRNLCSPSNCLNGQCLGHCGRAGSYRSDLSATESAGDDEQWTRSAPVSPMLGGGLSSDRDYDNDDGGESSAAESVRFSHVVEERVFDGTRIVVHRRSRSLDRYPFVGDSNSSSVAARDVRPYQKSVLAKRPSRSERQKAHTAAREEVEVLVELVNDLLSESEDHNAPFTDLSSAQQPKGGVQTVLDWTWDALIGRPTW
ncbi:protein phosphatase regulator [Sorochytrium milnesiophthora]